MKATIRINHSDNHLLWLIVCLNKRLATEFHESQIYCKKRILLAAKTDNKKGQMKPKKKDFNPNLYISNAGTNELPLKKSNTVIADDITKVVELLKFDLSSLATSAIVPKSLDRTKNFEEKIKEFNKVFVLKNRIKGIPLTSHDKHQP